MLYTFYLMALVLYFHKVEVLAKGYTFKFKAADVQIYMSAKEAVFLPVCEQDYLVAGCSMGLSHFMQIQNHRLDALCFKIDKDM